MRAAIYGCHVLARGFQRKFAAPSADGTAASIGSDRRDHPAPARAVNAYTNRLSLWSAGQDGIFKFGRGIGWWLLVVRCIFKTSSSCSRNRRGIRPRQAGGGGVPKVMHATWHAKSRIRDAGFEELIATV